MAALWLAAVLTPACCLLPTGPDPSSPPIKNLRVEPRQGRLTWDLNGNVSGITCSVDSGADIQAINNQYCQVHSHLIEKCKAKNFMVVVKTPRRFSASIRYPPQEGTPGAEAVGLECWVHDVTILTCRWGAGPAAPPDVRYRLYWEDLGSGEERECAGYQEDERGARVGCSFGDVSWASDQLQRFLVKGSAPDSAVPCSEVIAALREIERLSPPKLTGTCNHSHAVLRWQRPSRLQSLVAYELQLQKEAHPPEQARLFTENSMVLPNPGDFVVKIKAQSVLLRAISSKWSAPQYFRCKPQPEPEGGRPGILVASALGPLLAVVVVLLLCWRYSVPQKLFPPIPGVKDPLRDFLEEKKVVSKDTEDCPVARVQVVGET